MSTPNPTKQPPEPLAILGQGDNRREITEDTQCGLGLAQLICVFFVLLPLVGWLLERIRTK